MAELVHQTMAVDIGCLPADILEIIFSWLPWKDRKSASLVCREWEDIAFSSYYLRRICLRVPMCQFTAPDATVQDNDNRSTLITSWRKYRHIRCDRSSQCVRDFHIICCNVWGFFEAVILSFSDSLQSFQSNIPLAPVQVQTIIAFLPMLKKLTITLDVLICQASNITCLDWSNQAAPRRISRMEQLTLSVSDSKADLIRGNNVDFFVTGDQGAELHFQALKSIGKQVTDFTITAGERNVIPFLVQITTCFLNLTSLTINATRFPETPLPDLSNLKCLRILNLRGKFNFNILDQCLPLASLKELSLVIENHYMREMDGFFDQFSTLSPNVDDLYVCLPSGIILDNSMTEAICRNFRQLRKLQIWAYGALNPDSAVHTTEVHWNLLPLLEDAVLYCADLSVRRFTTGRLKRLQLRECYSINDADLVSLKAVFPELNHLEMLNCDQITQSGTDYFVRSFPEVQLKAKIKEWPYQ